MSMTRRQLMIAGLLAPLSSYQKNSLHIPDIDDSSAVYAAIEVKINPPKDFKGRVYALIIEYDGQSVRFTPEEVMDELRRDRTNPKS